MDFLKIISISFFIYIFIIQESQSLPNEKNKHNSDKNVNSHHNNLRVTKSKHENSNKKHKTHHVSAHKNDVVVQNQNEPQEDNVVSQNPQTAENQHAQAQQTQQSQQTQQAPAPQPAVPAQNGNMDEKYIQHQGQPCVPNNQPQTHPINQHILNCQPPQLPNPQQSLHTLQLQQQHEQMKKLCNTNLNVQNGQANAKDNGCPKLTPAQVAAQEAADAQHVALQAQQAADDAKQTVAQTAQQAQQIANQAQQHVNAAQAVASQKQAQASAAQQKAQQASQVAKYINNINNALQQQAQQNTACQQMMGQLQQNMQGMAPCNPPVINPNPCVNPPCTPAGGAGTNGGCVSGDCMAALANMAAACQNPPCPSQQEIPFGSPGNDQGFGMDQTVQIGICKSKFPKCRRQCTAKCPKKCCINKKQKHKE